MFIINTFVVIMVDRNYKSGKEKCNNEKEERSFG
jgi:hypothetical protein